MAVGLLLFARSAQTSELRGVKKKALSDRSSWTAVLVFVWKQRRLRPLKYCLISRAGKEELCDITQAAGIPVTRQVEQYWTIKKAPHFKIVLSVFRDWKTVFFLLSVLMCSTCASLPLSVPPLYKPCSWTRLGRTVAMVSWGFGCFFSWLWVADSKQMSDTHVSHPDFILQPNIAVSFICEYCWSLNPWVKLHSSAPHSTSTLATVNTNRKSTKIRRLSFVFCHLSVTRRLEKAGKAGAALQTDLKTSNFIRFFS